MEVLLKDNALITSKTDTKGIITYCNNHFIDISGYNEFELLGFPHNIIRHEDMPKCVFRLLWEYLKRQEEIFAYVKNRTKSGDFYWVFANVTPSYSYEGQVIGYYSVRRQVNSKALEIIKRLYEDLLGIEKSYGNQASYDKLLEVVKKSDLSYNNFIFNLQHS